LVGLKKILVLNIKSLLELAPLAYTLIMHIIGPFLTSLPKENMNILVIGFFLVLSNFE